LIEMVDARVLAAIAEGAAVHHETGQYRDAECDGAHLLRGAVQHAKEIAPRSRENVRTNERHKGRVEKSSGT